MHNVSPKLIKEAFISPIRFALLLDDEFPTYHQLVEGGSLSGFDPGRAGSLQNICRNNGWLCDVENSVRVAEKFERDKHLGQSDLLVLDFHLDPSKPDNPDKAISILQELSASLHFNLVIIYTGANPVEVVGDVAYSLGGGWITEAEREAASTALDDLDEDVYESLKRALSREVVFNFLQGKRPNGEANELRSILRGADILDGGLQNGIINFICDESLGSKFSPSILSSRSSSGKIESSFGKADGPKWLSKGNLFAVVVNKEEPPEVLVDRLEEALIGWNPSPLRVLMIYARAALGRFGTLADEKVLDTPRRQAGWLLRVLLADSDLERRKYINELYSRLFERLIHNVDQKTSDFGLELFHGTVGTPVEIARSMAMVPALIGNEFAYHALNEHLCSDSFVDGHITTGVIFRSFRGAQPSYWICATPACDLVPGQNSGGWDGDLHPYRPINAVRLSLIRDRTVIGERLKTATQGRHIFICVDDQPVAFEVTDEVSRQMKMEVLFVANQGAVQAARFSGFSVSSSGDAAPVMNSLDFEALAILRTEYASKFLAESGFQKSRIGVDFVNLEA
ncbi:response regulator receiver domain [Pseudomonas sp. BN515]|uniref:response regulator receiver domain n=1 Tax=Pseudomonas sp. BN515 TaxID=2567892 RepID=UPI002457761B|nr:response regulator receiver domain [Pseudomonas sp. BN515]MDH4870586.1 hypothetical protein [Pseudomonas sp. BN515]